MLVGWSACRFVWSEGGGIGKEGQRREEMEEMEEIDDVLFCFQVIQYKWTKIYFDMFYLQQ